MLKKQRTFDSNFAISLLALSFPFSTILILGVLSSGSLFSSASPVFMFSIILVAVGLAPALAKKVVRLRKKSEKEKMEKNPYSNKITARESP